MQTGLEVLNSVFNRFRLKINVAKTKSVIFNPKHTMDEPEYPKTICELNDLPVATNIPHQSINLFY